MRDLGWLKAEGAHLGEKIRHAHPRAPKFDDANAVEQICGEKRPQPGLALVGEWSSHGGMMLALFPQITGEPVDGLTNLLGAGLGYRETRPGVGILLSMAA